MEKNKKKRLGHIISNKMDKTVIVAVETRRAHPLYRRVVKRISKFMAHDEDNTCQMGDLVIIIENRPISKEKRWRVQEIVSRKEQVNVPDLLLEEQHDSTTD